MDYASKEYPFRVAANEGGLTLWPVSGNRWLLDFNTGREPDSLSRAIGKLRLPGTYRPGRQLLDLG